MTLEGLLYLSCFKGLYVKPMDVLTHAWAMNDKDYFRLLQVQSSKLLFLAFRLAGVNRLLTHSSNHHLNNC